jgi:arsenate reductase-like glutaredoxin family protein
LLTNYLYNLFTYCLCMSDVIAVRVTKKLKDELQELDLDYAQEVRNCLERMVKKRKLKEFMKQVDQSRKELSKKTGMTTPSADIIREDREHAH